MVIPAVRVIPGDKNRGVPPEWRLHNPIDGVNQKLLFQQRIGVAGMAILVGRSLQRLTGAPSGAKRATMFESANHGFQILNCDLSVT
jgi:hypothetical protein